jgi:EAL and modified HD-GYP domain-containing signal transduction protein
MATESITAGLLDDPLHEESRQQRLLQEQPVDELRYVARQPIMDLRSRVHGYELLFWNGRDPASRAESDQASRTMIDNTVIFGLDRLTCGLPAFVNCTPDSLSEQWVRVLPPNMTVVELPGDSEPTPSLIASCRNLKELGFRLALVDCTGKPESSALIEMADYIKVDVERFNAAGRGKLLGQLKGVSRLVAENVETQEEYAQLSKEGFKLFQGYYFCRPEPLKNHKIPANRAAHLEILQVLQNYPVDMDKLSRSVMCDASLTYRLLRLINSPLYAVGQKVTSIKSALMLMGEETARRIATLAIVSELNGGQSVEILRMAFVRARFCELAASLYGLIPAEQYLIGMISMFPAMLRTLMEDLVKSMPLRDQARQALLGVLNPEGALLYLAMCLESGDWATCNAIMHAGGMNYDQIIKCHTEAEGWANAVLASTD